MRSPKIRKTMFLVQKVCSLHIRHWGPLTISFFKKTTIWVGEVHLVLLRFFLYLYTFPAIKILNQKFFLITYYSQCPHIWNTFLPWYLSKRNFIILPKQWCPLWFEIQWFVLFLDKEKKISLKKNIFLLNFLNYYIFIYHYWFKLIAPVTILIRYPNTFLTKATFKFKICPLP